MRHIILALASGQRGSNQMTSVLCSQEQLNSRFRCVGSDICWGRRESAASRLFSINHLLKQRSRMCTCWCRFQWRANKIHGIQMNTFKTSRVRFFPFVSEENGVALRYIQYTTSSTTRTVWSAHETSLLTLMLFLWKLHKVGCNCSRSFISLSVPGQRSRVTTFQKYLQVRALTESVFACTAFVAWRCSASLNASSILLTLHFPWQRS